MDFSKETKAIHSGYKKDTQMTMAVPIYQAPRKSIIQQKRPLIDLR